MPTTAVSAARSSLPQLTSVEALHHPTVRGVCLGMCAQCGGTDRLFIETEAGVFSRCYQCGDESRLGHRPMSCPREHPPGLR